MGDLKNYRRERSEIELLLKYFNPKGKIIIDVGCGSGYLSFELVKKGAFVYGLDKKEVMQKISLEKHKKYPVFDTGSAEKLPLKKSFADVIIYYSSFHHVPKNKMMTALSECKRVLKPGGLALFIEPSPEKGFYYEILRYVVDEKKIQKYAHSLISKLEKLGFKPVAEKYFYLNRTFKDFLNRVNEYINRKNDRDTAIHKAEQKMKKTIFRSRSEYNNLFKSTARINVFKKTG